VPTVVYGDFEWDEAKAIANATKHGVGFEEAAQALTDPHAVDFSDALYPTGWLRWRCPPGSVSFTSSAPSAGPAFASSARGARPFMSDPSTKTNPDPSVESLADMPEVTDESRFRRRAGRGHHANLRAGDLVRIEPDLLAHFGSVEAVNEALREIVAAKRGR